MNVTPDITAPAMAKATSGHGVRRFPVKKVAFVARREASREIVSSSAK
jgi:hypothetical protein